MRDLVRKNLRNKEWAKQRRKERREFAYSYLGNKCAVCSSTKDLEIDHIDKTTKHKSVSLLWTSSEAIFINELKKCQLLCKTHHKIKTKQEHGWPLGHGTYANYRKRGCRCELCCEAYRKYHRDYAAGRLSG